MFHIDAKTSPYHLLIFNILILAVPKPSWLPEEQNHLKCDGVLTAEMLYGNEKKQLCSQKLGIY